MINTLKSRMMAEFLGTWALVFTGTGAVASHQEVVGQVTHVGIGIVFGCIVLALIYAFGDLSGAHFNPAVTLSFGVAGRFSKKEIIPYILAQCTGACLGSWCVSLLFPNNQTIGITLPAGSFSQAFLMEYLLTFLLMLVILQVSTGSKEKGVMAGVAIGAVVALEAIFGGPVSGASMNPARSLGPALFSGIWDSHWLYWLAPTLGALSAVPMCKLMRTSNCCEVDC